MITEKHFIDWESHVFGYGYGTGERHTIPVLRGFLAHTFGVSNSYDFRVMEKELGPEQFWLLLNTLCHADIIEYDTSPRFGRLTSRGVLLRDFMLRRSLEEAITLTRFGIETGFMPCYPNYCNCDYEPCDNPLFTKGS